MSKLNKRTIRIVAVLLAVVTFAAVCCLSQNVFAAKSDVTYIDNTAEVQELMKNATQFVLVRQKQLGGSHYAYTEAVSDERSEYNFRAGSKLCLVTLEVDEKEPEKVKVTETVLITSSTGVLRDPDVSEDGTKIVYSHKKKDNDDYHLYEYDLTTKKSKQLTFGSGTADIEPVYTGNGTIVFSSTRDVQTVDCWHTPISNLYMCNADGSGITRLGYDQVHTTYPTSTTDGRILYTRWDYNDRNQMYVQALFQMFPDGTLQTEVFGNNANNPTTLLHTREIPDYSYKYVTIISGHHMNQVGKLAVVDTSKGRNDRAAVDYVYEDSATRQLAGGAQSIDNHLFQEGNVFKYPYAYSENLFTVSMSTKYEGKSDAPFDIVLMNEKGKYQTLVKSDGAYPASQFVPIQTEELFSRSSMVNYAKDTGTYYIADVYQGEPMKGVKRGTAKYIRVVALSFRPFALGATNSFGTGSADPYSPIATGNGAWDIKQVLGIVPIEADGSALFTVPSETPLYFQILDENGDMIQTMRSWSTLMPGESFSCIGCHVDKNTAPQTSLKVTDAMRKGVQELQADLWMENYEEYKDFDPYEDEYIGFDYLSVVQPILDESCVTCHSNTDKAFTRINLNKMKNAAKDEERAEYVFYDDVEWSFTKADPGANWYKTEFDDSKWESSAAPFGKVDVNANPVNTVWKDTDTLWLRRTVNITQYDAEKGIFTFELAHSGNISIYLNGTLVYSGNDNGSLNTKTVILNEEYRNLLNVGENVLAVKVTSLNSGKYFALALRAKAAEGSAGSVSSTVTLFERGAEVLYFTSANNEFADTAWTNADFDDSAWKKQNTPLGNRINGSNSSDWSGDSPYLWVRYEFDVADKSKFSNAILEMDAFYDDDIKVYVNGKLVYSHDKWNDGYTKYDLDGGAKAIVNGKNVIAVSLYQHTGGFEWDAAFTANIMSGNVLASNAPISFEAIQIAGERMEKYFPLSYLVLTGSHPQGDYEWVADTANSYTNYISSMSQCEMLSAYAGGSTKSKIIQKLRSGHADLDDSEIAAISCWIDLCVPCYGEYDPEGQTTWDNDGERHSNEKNNKRHIYDVLDRYAKMERAGTLKGEISISLGSDTASGVGYAVLYTNKKPSAGTFKVTLPEGEKYVGLSFASRAGEAIIYCPNGNLEFKFPVSFKNVAPETFTSYLETTIVARVVYEDELKKERNLALNPYDCSALTNGYPHVETSEKITDILKSGRNVIDGFTANQAKGSYPSQAWEPEELKSSDYIMINYGREVTLTELVILMRNAPGDTHFTSCTVEFSNGSKMDISLKDSNVGQIFELDSVKTTYVKLTNFVSANSNKAAAITEIETWGYDNVG